MNDLARLALEEATLAAWPAREQAQQFGWRLLAEYGATGRVNAVWPLAWTAKADLGAAIAAAEAWYAQRRLPCVFKVADGAVAPAELPEALTRRGYVADTETLVMTGPCRLPAPPVRAAITLEFQAAGPFDDVLAATAASAADLAERRAVIARAPTPKAFAVARVNGQARAVGMTALPPQGLAGVFAMRTAPEARRQGLAQALLAALGAYAHDQGATGLFLQVEAANTPAVRLYQKVGFNTAYAYRFWRKP